MMPWSAPTGSGKKERGLRAKGKMTDDDPNEAYEVVPREPG